MDKLKFLWSKTNRWHRIIVLFLVVEFRLLPSPQYGFQCKDPALSHPFTGDTITLKWLMSTVILLPLIAMLIVERLYNVEETAARSRGRVVFWYKEYLYGFLVNLTVVQFVKMLVSSPRPHFFDTCNPKEALTCQGTEFVSSYTCLKAHWLSQSDRSFPSGHTALAVHAGLFIAYYLHQRTSHIPRPRAILTVQILSVFSAVYCSISRIIDRRHHWWDVLAGAVIAAPILVYTIYSLCDNFHCPRTPCEEEKSNGTTSHHDVIETDAT